MSQSIVCRALLLSGLLLASTGLRSEPVPTGPLTLAKAVRDYT